MTGQIDINEPLPLIVVNEECVEIIGRAYAYFKNPYRTLEWLIAKNADMDRQAPIFLMNYGRAPKVLRAVKEKGIK